MSDTETPDAETPRFERKATLRLGQRELKLISLTVVLVIVGALGIAAYRAIMNFKAHRDIVVAKDHLHTLYVAMLSYGNDWDGKLPPADKWMDSVAGYLSAPPNTPGGKESYLHGAGDEGTVGYVYNDLASNYQMESTGKEEGRKRIDPSKMVLLIEKVGAPDNAHMEIPLQTNDQAQEALAKALSFPHYADDTVNATAVILYANGNIVTVTRRDLSH